MASNLCELADVTVEAKGTKTTVRVPAYSRPPDEFQEKVLDILSIYMLRSSPNGMSLADFAMFVISFASKEPREQ